ncbi:RNA polymerase sigma factor [Candidatus Sulfopaludibacter sp. SbA4]|nr:RNA polymerase sigma factor [Candidatus Sulfopaludibacter sp. SbA4]
MEMTQTSKTDDGLVVELQRRNRDAMEELYDRYGRLAFSVILRMVHDAGIAEDLVQETFLRVWNRIQFYDASKGAIGPWLLAIARYRAIDYLRSVRSRNCHTVAYDEAEADRRSLTAEVAAFENGRRVRAAMRKLVPNHLRVIEMAYFEGLSQVEVAERMGQPLGTVKSWVRMAIRRLREELVPEGAFSVQRSAIGFR